MGRVELDGIGGPRAQARRRGVVVQAPGGGELLEHQAQLAQAGQALGGVGTERDGAGQRGAVEEVARGGAGRARQPGPAELGDERPRLARTPHRLVLVGLAGAGRALPEEVGGVEGEEGRAQQRGLRDAVVAVGERPQAEEELPDQRIGEEERAAARGVGDALGVEPGEQRHQAPGGDGEDGHVAVLHAPRAPGQRVGDPDAARVHQPAKVAGDGLALERPVLVHPVPASVVEVGREHVHRPRPVVRPVAGAGPRRLAPVLALHRQSRPRAVAGAAGSQGPVEDGAGGGVEGPAVGRPAEDPLEAVVQPRDQRRHAAEVRRQRHRQVRAAGDEPPHPVVGRDVGAAEAVDGLLGIADQGEGAAAEADLVPARGGGPALAEVEDDLGLQGVGVLELVTKTWSNRRWSAPRTSRSRARRSRSFSSR